MVSCASTSTRWSRELQERRAHVTHVAPSPHLDYVRVTAAAAFADLRVRQLAAPLKTGTTKRDHFERVKEIKITVFERVKEIKITVFERVKEIK